MENNSIEFIKLQLLSDHSFLKKLQISFLQQNSSRFPINDLIQQIRELLQELIRHQIEHQLRQIINDNNRILSEIKDRIQARPAFHQLGDISFGEVHRLMEGERKKMQCNEQLNDASIDKSISAFVELKMQTFQQRFISMEEKYDTNLKSIWNVLSITQSTLFDHLQLSKDKEKSKEEKDSGTEGEDKKSKFGFFGFKA